MKEKLGVQVPPYRILGACNPSLAHQALQAVPDIGLLLPCNVIVREQAPDHVVVGFLDPQIMVNLVGKPEVKSVADSAEQRLRRACESLGGSATRGTRYISLRASRPAMLQHQRTAEIDATICARGIVPR
jgi:hypothetical protein